MSEKRLKIAFIFPGQGESHYIGMGKDFYDSFAIAKETFEHANDILGFDLKSLIFHGNIKELTETNNCQVALYVNSIAILRVLQSQFSQIYPYVCAGLSLGEYSAVVASGRLSFEDGVRLVRLRGELMQSACEEKKGKMAVVLGLNPESIKETLKENHIEDVYIANLNCPGQIVISGTEFGIEKALPLIKAKGAKRALPLNVIGAFHSPLMNSAQLGLEKAIDRVALNDSQISLVMNVTGSLETCTDKIKNNLVSQLTCSVLWEKSVKLMSSMDLDLFLEVGCGKVLAGLNKRIGVTQPTISIDKLQDLNGLEESINLKPALLGGEK